MLTDELAVCPEDQMLQALGRPKNPRKAMTERSSAGSLVFNELGDTVSASDECCETRNPENVFV